MVDSQHNHKTKYRIRAVVSAIRFIHRLKKPFTQNIDQSVQYIKL